MFYDGVVSLRSVSLSFIKLFRSFPVIFVFNSRLFFRTKAPEAARPERAEAPRRMCHYSSDYADASDSFAVFRITHGI